MNLDLSSLPPMRRVRVLGAFERESAAERIRQVYPVKLSNYHKEEAVSRTADVLRGEGFGFVTGRWVRRVIFEGR